MKDFMCDLLRGISMIGSVVGFILIASDAIEKLYAFVIFFGFMFLYFLAEGIDDEGTETKGQEDIME